VPPPYDPPRQRANKKRGHGDDAGDRPAVFGAVSRQTGEVHSNTMEGLWTSLRHWLRPFRRVSKKYLQGDVAAFEWGYSRKRVDKEELWKIVSRMVDKELFS
jgi:hypothetical protein